MKDALSLGLSNPWSVRHMWLRMAMNVAQHRIVNLFKTFFLLVFVYLMCGPRQLFQSGPEMPKGWTPLDGLCMVGYLKFLMSGTILPFIGLVFDVSK